MNKHLLSSVIVTAFAWTIAAPTLAAVFEHPDTRHVSAVTHSDGTPCPDEDDDGPCDGSCPCTCCAGHTTAILAPFAVCLPKPHIEPLHRSGPPDTDPPTGIHLRVFRPPRV